MQRAADATRTATRRAPTTAHRARAACGACCTPRRVCRSTFVARWRHVGQVRPGWLRVAQVSRRRYSAASVACSPCAYCVLTVCCRVISACSSRDLRMLIACSARLTAAARRPPSRARRTLVCSTRSTRPPPPRAPVRGTTRSQRTNPASTRRARGEHAASTRRARFTSRSAFCATSSIACTRGERSVCSTAHGACASGGSNAQRYGRTADASGRARWRAPASAGAATANGHLSVAAGR
jgi:hypothetical protein